MFPKRKSGSSSSHSIISQSPTQQTKQKAKNHEKTHPLGCSQIKITHFSDGKRSIHDILTPKYPTKPAQDE
jgi:hypothetical protein